MPKFGTLIFSNCIIDGVTLAAALPEEHQRVNSSNVIQIGTGPVLPAGTAFATRYKHS